MDAILDMASDEFVAVVRHEESGGNRLVVTVSDSQGELPVWTLFPDGNRFIVRCEGDSPADVRRVVEYASSAVRQILHVIGVVNGGGMSGGDIAAIAQSLAGLRPRGFVELLVERLPNDAVRATVTVGDPPAGGAEDRQPHTERFGAFGVIDPVPAVAANGPTTWARELADRLSEVSAAEGSAGVAREWEQVVGQGRAWEAVGDWRVGELPGVPGLWRSRANVRWLIVEQSRTAEFDEEGLTDEQRLHKRRVDDVVETLRRLANMFPRLEIQLLSLAPCAISIGSVDLTDRILIDTNLSALGAGGTFAEVRLRRELARRPDATCSWLGVWPRIDLRAAGGDRVLAHGAADGRASDVLGPPLFTIVDGIGASRRHCAATLSSERTPKFVLRDLNPDLQITRRDRRHLWQRLGLRIAKRRRGGDLSIDHPALGGTWPMRSLWADTVTAAHASLARLLEGPRAALDSGTVGELRPGSRDCVRRLIERMVRLGLVPGTSDAAEDSLEYLQDSVGRRLNVVDGGLEGIRRMLLSGADGNFAVALFEGTNDQHAVSFDVVTRGQQRHIMVSDSLIGGYFEFEAWLKELRKSWPEVYALMTRARASAAFFNWEAGERWEDAGFTPLPEPVDADARRPDATKPVHGVDDADVAPSGEAAEAEPETTSGAETGTPGEELAPEPVGVATRADDSSEPNRDAAACVRASTPNGEAQVVVVAHGVLLSPGAGAASTAAVAAAEEIAEALTDGATAVVAQRRGFRTAAAGVAAAATDSPEGYAPATSYTSVIVAPNGRVTVTSLGGGPVYFVPDAGLPVQLADAGRVGLYETRYLANGENYRPHETTFTPTVPGLVVVGGPGHAEAFAAPADVRDLFNRLTFGPSPAFDPDDAAAAAAALATVALGPSSTVGVLRVSPSPHGERTGGQGADSDESQAASSYEAFPDTVAEPLLRLDGHVLSLNERADERTLSGEQLFVPFLRGLDLHTVRKTWTAEQFAAGIGDDFVVNVLADSGFSMVGEPEYAADGSTVTVGFHRPVWSVQADAPTAVPDPRQPAPHNLSGAARRVVRAQTAGWPPQRRDDAELVTSELFALADEKRTGSEYPRVGIPDWVVGPVTVSGEMVDGSHGPALRLTVSALGERNRTERSELIAALNDRLVNRWGVDPGTGDLWFELDMERPPEPSGPPRTERRPQPAAGMSTALSLGDIFDQLDFAEFVAVSKELKVARRSGETEEAAKLRKTRSRHVVDQAEQRALDGLAPLLTGTFKGLQLGNGSVGITPTIDTTLASETRRGLQLVPESWTEPEVVMVVSADILDGDREVGRFELHVRQEHPGRLVVDHWVLGIDESVRRRGFGSEFVAVLFDYLRRSRVAELHVHTWSDDRNRDGGFFWALMGFDWDPQPAQLAYTVRSLDIRINQLLDPVLHPDLSPSDRADLESLRTTLAGPVAGYPTPRDLATGHFGAHPHTANRHLGVLLMDRLPWNAVYHFSDDPIAAASQEVAPDGSATMALGREFSTARIWLAAEWSRLRAVGEAAALERCDELQELIYDFEEWGRELGAARRDYAVAVAERAALGAVDPVPPAIVGRVEHAARRLSEIRSVIREALGRLESAATRPAHYDPKKAIGYVLKDRFEQSYAYDIERLFDPASSEPMPTHTEALARLRDLGPNSAVLVLDAGEPPYLITNEGDIFLEDRPHQDELSESRDVMFPGTARAVFLDGNGTTSRAARALGSTPAASWAWASGEDDEVWAAAEELLGNWLVRPGDWGLRAGMLTDVLCLTAELTRPATIDPVTWLQGLMTIEVDFAVFTATGERQVSESGLPERIRELAEEILGRWQQSPTDPDVRSRVLHMVDEMRPAEPHTGRQRGREPREQAAPTDFRDVSDRLYRIHRADHGVLTIGAVGADHPLDDNEVVLCRLPRQSDTAAPLDYHLSRKAGDNADLGRLTGVVKLPTFTEINLLPPRNAADEGHDSYVLDMAMLLALMLKPGGKLTVGISEWSDRRLFDPDLLEKLRWAGFEQISVTPTAITAMKPVDSRPSPVAVSPEVGHTPGTGPGAAVVAEVRKLMKFHRAMWGNFDQPVRFVDQWGASPKPGQLPSINEFQYLNCWEYLLYAAVCAGVLTHAQVHHIVMTDRPDIPVGARLPPGYLESTIPDLLAPRGRRAYRLGDPSCPAPVCGQLVFFNGGGHVAIATGATHRDGSPELLSFWPPPYDWSPRGADTFAQLDTAKPTSIMEMYCYLIEVRLADQVVIEVGDGPWHTDDTGGTGGTQRPSAPASPPLPGSGSTESAEPVSSHGRPPQPTVVFEDVGPTRDRSAEPPDTEAVGDGPRQTGDERDGNAAAVRAAEPVLAAEVIRNCAIHVARVHRALGIDAAHEPDDTDQRWDDEDNWRIIEEQLGNQLRPFETAGVDPVRAAVGIIRDPSNDIESAAITVDGHIHYIVRVEGVAGEKILVFDNEIDDTDAVRARSIDGDENGDNRWEPSYRNVTGVFGAFWVTRNGVPVPAHEPVPDHLRQAHPRKLLGYSAASKGDSSAESRAADTTQPPRSRYLFTRDEDGNWSIDEGPTPPSEHLYTLGPDGDWSIGQPPDISLGELVHRNRRFTTTYGLDVANAFGTTLSSIAAPYVTSNPTIAAWMAAAGGVSQAAALHAGYKVDTRGPEWAMRRGAVAGGAAALAAFGSVVTRVPHLDLILPAAMLAESIAATYFINGAQKIFWDSLRREEQSAGNGAQAMPIGTIGGQLLAPALAAVPWLPIGVDAVLWGAGLGAMRILHNNHPPRQSGASRGFVNDIRESHRELRGNRFLWGYTGIAGLSSIALGGLMDHYLDIVHASQLPEWAKGAMIAVYAAGGVAGMFPGDKIRSFVNESDINNFYRTTLVGAAALTAFGSASDNLIPLALALSGLGWSSVNLGRRITSFQQREIPAHLSGRVSAEIAAVSASAMAAGYLADGYAHNSLIPTAVATAAAAGSFLLRRQGKGVPPDVESSSEPGVRPTVDPAQRQLSLVRIGHARRSARVTLKHLETAADRATHLWGLDADTPIHLRVAAARESQDPKNSLHAELLADLERCAAATDAMRRVDAAAAQAQEAQRRRAYADARVGTADTPDEARSWERRGDLAAAKEEECLADLDSLLADDALSSVFAASIFVPHDPVFAARQTLADLYGTDAVPMPAHHPGAAVLTDIEIFTGAEDFIRTLPEPAVWPQLLYGLGDGSSLTVLDAAEDPYVLVNEDGVILKMVPSGDIQPFDGALPVGSARGVFLTSSPKPVVPPGIEAITDAAVIESPAARQEPECDSRGIRLYHSSSLDKDVDVKELHLAIPDPGTPTGSSPTSVDTGHGSIVTEILERQNDIDYIIVPADMVASAAEYVDRHNAASGASVELIGAVAEDEIDEFLAAGWKAESAGDHPSPGVSSHVAGYIPVLDKWMDDGQTVLEEHSVEPVAAWAVAALRQGNHGRVIDVFGNVIDLRDSRVVAAVTGAHRQREQDPAGRARRESQTWPTGVSSNWWELPEAEQRRFVPAPEEGSVWHVVFDPNDPELDVDRAVRQISAMLRGMRWDSRLRATAFVRRMTLEARAHREFAMLTVAVARTDRAAHARIHYTAKTIRSEGRPWITGGSQQSASSPGELGHAHWEATFGYRTPQWDRPWGREELAGAPLPAMLRAAALHALFKLTRGRPQASDYAGIVAMARRLFGQGDLSRAESRLRDDELAAWQTLTRDERAELLAALPQLAGMRGGPDLDGRRLTSEAKRALVVDALARAKDLTPSERRLLTDLAAIPAAMRAASESVAQTLENEVPILSLWSVRPYAYRGEYASDDDCQLMIAIGDPLFADNSRLPAHLQRRPRLVIKVVDAGEQSPTSPWDIGPQLSGALMEFAGEQKDNPDSTVAFLVMFRRSQDVSRGAAMLTDEIRMLHDAWDRQTTYRADGRPKVLVQGEGLGAKIVKRATEIHDHGMDGTRAIPMPDVEVAPSIVRQAMEGMQASWEKFFRDEQHMLTKFAMRIGSEAEETELLSPAELLRRDMLPPDIYSSAWDYHRADIRHRVLSAAGAACISTVVSWVATTRQLESEPPHRRWANANHHKNQLDRRRSALDSILKGSPGSVRPDPPEHRVLAYTDAELCAMAPTGRRSAKTRAADLVEQLEQVDGAWTHIVIGEGSQRHTQLWINHGGTVVIVERQTGIVRPVAAHEPAVPVAAIFDRHMNIIDGSENVDTYGDLSHSAPEWFVRLYTAGQAAQSDTVENELLRSAQLVLRVPLAGQYHRDRSRLSEPVYRTRFTSSETAIAGRYPNRVQSAATAVNLEFQEKLRQANVTGSREDDARLDSGTAAVLAIAVLSGNPAIRTPQAMPGDDHIPAFELAAALGGELQEFRDHGSVLNALTSLELEPRGMPEWAEGAGHHRHGMALVIDRHSDGSEHPYVVVVDRGVPWILEWDGASPAYRPFPPPRSSSIVSTCAVMVTDDNEMASPLSPDVRTYIDNIREMAATLDIESPERAALYREATHLVSNAEYRFAPMGQWTVEYTESGEAAVFYDSGQQSGDTRAAATRIPIDNVEFGSNGPAGQGSVLPEGMDSLLAIHAQRKFHGKPVDDLAMPLIEVGRGSLVAQSWILDAKPESVGEGNTALSEMGAWVSAQPWRAVVVNERNNKGRTSTYLLVSDEDRRTTRIEHELVTSSSGRPWVTPVFTTLDKVEAKNPHATVTAYRVDGNGSPVDPMDSGSDRRPNRADGWGRWLENAYVTADPSRRLEIHVPDELIAKVRSGATVYIKGPNLCMCDFADDGFAVAECNLPDADRAAVEAVAALITVLAPHCFEPGQLVLEILADNVHTTAPGHGDVTGNPVFDDEETRRAFLTTTRQMCEAKFPGIDIVVHPEDERAPDALAMIDWLNEQGCIEVVRDDDGEMKDVHFVVPEPKSPENRAPRRVRLMDDHKLSRVALDVAGPWSELRKPWTSRVRVTIVADAADAPQLRTEQDESWELLRYFGLPGMRRHDGQPNVGQFRLEANRRHTEVSPAPTPWSRLFSRTVPLAAGREGTANAGDTVVEALAMCAWPGTHPDLSDDLRSVASELAAKILERGTGGEMQVVVSGPEGRRVLTVTFTGADPAPPVFETVDHSTSDAAENGSDITVLGRSLGDNPRLSFGVRVHPGGKDVELRLVQSTSQLQPSDGVLEGAERATSDAAGVIRWGITIPRSEVEEAVSAQATHVHTRMRAMGWPEAQCVHAAQAVATWIEYTPDGPPGPRALRVSISATEVGVQFADDSADLDVPEPDTLFPRNLSADKYPGEWGYQLRRQPDLAPEPPHESSAGSARGVRMMWFTLHRAASSTADESDETRSGDSHEPMSAEHTGPGTAVGKVVMPWMGTDSTPSGTSSSHAPAPLDGLVLATPWKAHRPNGTGTSPLPDGAGPGADRSTAPPGPANGARDRKASPGSAREKRGGKSLLPLWSYDRAAERATPRRGGRDADLLSGSRFGIAFGPGALAIGARPSDDPGGIDGYAGYEGARTPSESPAAASVHPQDESVNPEPKSLVVSQGADRNGSVSHEEGPRADDPDLDAEQWSLPDLLESDRHLFGPHLRPGPNHTVPIAGPWGMYTVVIRTETDAVQPYLSAHHPGMNQYVLAVPSGASRLAAGRIIARELERVRALAQYLDLPLSSRSDVPEMSIGLMGRFAELRYVMATMDQSHGEPNRDVRTALDELLIALHLDVPSRDTEKRLALLHDWDPEARLPDRLCELIPTLRAAGVTRTAAWPDAEPPVVAQLLERIRNGRPPYWRIEPVGPRRLPTGSGRKLDISRLYQLIDSEGHAIAGREWSWDSRLGLFVKDGENPVEVTIGLMPYWDTGDAAIYSAPSGFVVLLPPGLTDREVGPAVRDALLQIRFVRQRHTRPTLLGGRAGWWSDADIVGRLGRLDLLARRLDRTAGDPLSVEFAWHRADFAAVIADLDQQTASHPAAEWTTFHAAIDPWAAERTTHWRTRLGLISTSSGPGPVDWTDAIFDRYVYRIGLCEGPRLPPDLPSFVSTMARLVDDDLAFIEDERVIRQGRRFEVRDVGGRTWKVGFVVDPLPDDVVASISRSPGNWVLVAISNNVRTADVSGAVTFALGKLIEPGNPSIGGYRHIRLLVGKMDKSHSADERRMLGGKLVAVAAEHRMRPGDREFEARVAELRATQGVVVADRFRELIFELADNRVAVPVENRNRPDSVLSVLSQAVTANARQQTGRRRAGVVGEVWDLAPVETAQAMVRGGIETLHAPFPIALQLKAVHLDADVISTGLALDRHVVETALDADVIIGVASWDQLQLVASIGEERGRPVKITVEADTGRNSGGFAMNGIPDVLVELTRLLQLGRIRLCGVFTELDHDDEPWHPKNEVQASRFDRVWEEFRNSSISPERVHFHIAGAAMAVRPDLSSASLARIGAPLYGLGAPSVNLEHAITWSAHVAAVRDVAAGEPVGYFGESVDRPRRIAWIGLGYGDGLPDLLGKQGRIGMSGW